MLPEEEEHLGSFSQDLLGASLLQESNTGPDEPDGLSGNLLRRSSTEPTPARRQAPRVDGSKDRSRGWCFTVNVKEFFEDADFRVKCLGLFQETRAGYFIAEPEIAGTTGQRHYQGYIHWSDGTKRFNYVREHIHNAFGIYGHIEAARGTPAENRIYCTKEAADKAVELGELPVQGNRTDLARLATEIIEGKSLTDIAYDHPADYIRYHGGIKALHTLTNSNPRDINVVPTVYWFFGPTGAGKSWKAYEMFGDSAYRKEEGMWWDGYSGQRQVILDEYRTNWFPFGTLLKILDRYPLRVQIKGTSTELSASVFVITTWARPEVLWASQTSEKLDQLLRRITHITEFSMNGVARVQKELKRPATETQSQIVYRPYSREEVAEKYPPKDTAQPISF